MAKTKKTENVRSVTGYEAKLIAALDAAVKIGLKTDNMSEHMDIYEDLYTAAYYFIEKVALSKYREKLESRCINPDEVANSVAEELFWRKLDYIMNSHDPINCRGLINNTVKFRVYDAINSDKRAQNDTDVVIPNDDEDYELTGDTTYSKANVHFTDVGWNLVASNTNLEEEAIVRDECIVIMDALKRNTNMFEVVSFLATKLVGYKASVLATELIEHGKALVYATVLQQVSNMLDLGNGYFKDAAFDIGDMELKYSEVKKLSAEISHGSDRAKNKVRKLIGKSK